MFVVVMLGSSSVSSCSGFFLMYGQWTHYDLINCAVVCMFISVLSHLDCRISTILTKMSLTEILANLCLQLFNGLFLL